jgi:hypothetical protein
VQYKDAEGDLITIASELEWNEMFSQFPDLKLFKMYLSEAPTPVELQNKDYPAKSFSCCSRPWRKGALLPHALQRKGLSQLHEKLYNEASLTFRAQCILQPENPIPHYNVACSESLMGNTANALEYLHKSINLGFNDLNHILKDEDLANINHTDEFQLACDRLRNSTKPQPHNQTSSPISSQPQPDLKESQPPNQTSSPVSNQPQPDLKESLPSTQNASPISSQVQPDLKEPKPTPIRNDPSPWAKQLELMHDMGYYEDQLIVPLLQKFKGDIQRTLQMLLGDEELIE